MSVGPGEAAGAAANREQEVVGLYNRSEALYDSGQFEKAKEGYETVLKSGLVPPDMARTIESRLADIDDRAARSKQNEEIAALFYSSVNSYREGKLEDARKGFVTVLNSGLIPPAMEKTIKNYLAAIDDALTKRQGIRPQ